METPAAAPMGLACQSLLVRDDGGGVRHPFQYRGAGPTSASDLKHRISGVVSKADHAMFCGRARLTSDVVWRIVEDELFGLLGRGRIDGDQFDAWPRQDSSPDRQ